MSSVGIDPMEKLAGGGVMDGYAYLMVRSASGGSGYAISYGPKEEMKSRLLDIDELLRSEYYVSEGGKSRGSSANA